MTALSDVLTEIRPGFACGLEDADGIFQFRMHNVSNQSDLLLNKRRRIPHHAHKRMDSFLVRPNDVLFNATNSPDGVGKSVLVPELDEPAVFSNHFMRLRPDPQRLDPAYLWRWLQLQFRRGVFLRMCRQWVNQATVSRERLVALDIPLPSLAEQRRIATILDLADAVRAKRRQVLAHLDALTQSIFHDMFGGVRATATVDEIVNVIRTGPFGSQLLKEELIDDGIAVLGLDNVVGNEFRWGERRYITIEKYKQLKRYTVHPGDVLISIMGTTGRCVVVPADIPPAINTKHICAITPDREQLDPAFLRAAFLWHPDSREHLRRQTKGSIMDGLNMGIIKAMPIPIPKMDLQRDFSTRAAAIDSRRSAVRHALAADDELFASLQSRAFRGEL